jgi:YegS/Rv2252/BmrU family lipid kinase
MGRKTKLIFNPVANLGRAKSITSSLQSILPEFDQVVWTETTHHGHAIELAARAADEGFDQVVALGGDGTMNEVLNGLMSIPLNRRPFLGVIPVGSGNDFAYACGLPSDPVLALRQTLAGTPHPVDVGMLQVNGTTTSYWANAIGIGFDTIVTLDSRNMKFVKGFAIYFLSVLQAILFQYEPFHLQMKMDGEDWERTLLMLVLMNGKREGGGFHVTPHALPDDGLLDLLGIDKINRLRMLQILPEVLKGTHERLKECPTRRFKNISIQANRPLYVHADGEIIATPPTNCISLSINILERAIEVVR